jgi:hypothetical protein
MLQFFIELNKTVFSHAHLNHLDDFIVNRDWAIPEADHLTNATSEPNFSQHAPRIEPRKQVTREK